MKTRIESALRRRAGPLIASLACAAALSGCSILFSIPAQLAKDHSDKKTRTEAVGLRSLAPGTLVLMRQHHHEPEVVRFEGFLVADTVAAVPADSTTAVAVFRRGPSRWELPPEEIDWVQLRSSRRSVYSWFGIGLVIDAGVIYLLARALSGLGSMS